MATLNTRQQVIAEAAKHAAIEHGLPPEATNFYPLATTIYDLRVGPLLTRLEKVRHLALDALEHGQTLDIYDVLEQVGDDLDASIEED